MSSDAFYSALLGAAFLIVFVFIFGAIGVWLSSRKKKKERPLGPYFVEIRWNDGPYELLGMVQQEDQDAWKNRMRDPDITCICFKRGTTEEVFLKRHMRSVKFFQE